MQMHIKLRMLLSPKCYMLPPRPRSGAPAGAPKVLPELELLAPNLSPFYARPPKVLETMAFYTETESDLQGFCAFDTSGPKPSLFVEPVEFLYKAFEIRT